MTVWRSSCKKAQEKSRAISSAFFILYAVSAVSVFPYGLPMFPVLFFYVRRVLKEHYALYSDGLVRFFVPDAALHGYVLSVLLRVCANEDFSTMHYVLRKAQYRPTGDAVCENSDWHMSRTKLQPQ